MSPFAQLCLLVRCALGNEADPAGAMAAARLDSDELIRLSLVHRVAAFLHIVAADPCLGPILPGELRDALPVVHEANAARNVQLRRQLGGLIGLLNDADIEPVLLKGAARLVDGAYADPAGRFMGDLDLLVPEAQLATADRCLRAAGYYSDDAHRNPDEHHHLPMLRHDDAVVGVELHRAMARPWHAALLPPADVVARSTPTFVEGHRARLPAPRDSVVHLIAHSQLQSHRFVTGGILLSDIVECVLLARAAGPEPLRAALEAGRHAGVGLSFETFLDICALVSGERIALAGASTPASRLLARRGMWQQDHRAAQVASVIVEHLIRTMLVLPRYPSVRRRFPRRLAQADFYSSRWREFRRLFRG
ncbi:MAG: nucleotidyltransferase family protein [Pseudochelatococcus sp.]|jgi:hypothetical protein|uniref:nucleotidyltransferase family protein n=1 Tax=Pseudochelatococcus sp. TaxID=2020869 RepID=UPI003D936B84